MGVGGGAEAEVVRKDYLEEWPGPRAKGCRKNRSKNVRVHCGGRRWVALNSKQKKEHVGRPGGKASYREKERRPVQAL